MSNKLFFITELATSIITLLLGCAMGLSYCSKAKTMQAYRKGKTILTIGYLALGAIMLLFTLSYKGYHEELVLQYIHVILPIECLFTLLSLVYPMSIRLRKEWFLNKYHYTLWGVWGTLYVYSRINHADIHLWYELILILGLLVFYTIYSRIFLRLNTIWKHYFPHLKTRQKLIYQMWISHLAIGLIGIYAILLPSSTIHYIIIIIYTIFLILYTLAYQNLGIILTQSLKLRRKYSKSSQAVASTIKEKNINDVIQASESAEKGNHTTASIHMGDNERKRIHAQLEKWKESKSFLQPKVSLVVLSKEIGTNRTYLSTYINETHDCNFNTWINKLRIEEAQNMMLKHPNWSLSRISDKTGFSELAQFSRIFKNTTGESPTKWKKINNIDIPL